MKANILQLDPELAAKLDAYSEGDEVQCMVTGTMGADGSLTVTDIEPEDASETEAEPAEEAPSKSPMMAPALKKALKA